MMAFQQSLYNSVESGMQRKDDEYLNHYTAIIALYVNAEQSAVGLFIVAAGCNWLQTLFGVGRPTKRRVGRRSSSDRQLCDWKVPVYLEVLMDKLFLCLSLSRTFKHCQAPSEYTNRTVHPAVWDLFITHLSD